MLSLASPTVLLRLALVVMWSFCVRGAHAQVPAPAQTGWPVENVIDVIFGPLVSADSWSGVAFDNANGIRVFQEDGTLWGGWTEFVYQNGVEFWMQNTRFGDLDGDGSQELLVPWAIYSTSSNRLYAFHADGSRLPAWDPMQVGIPTNLTHDHVALADIDGDGDHEVVTVGLAIQPPLDPYSFQVAVHVFQPDGTEVPGWPQLLGPGDVPRGLAVGDLDFDGTPEIVVCGFKVTPTDPFEESPIYVFESDGQLRSGWPVTPASVGPWAEGYMESPRIADLDGDGYCEIVGTTAAVFRVYSHDGQLLDWRLNAFGPGQSIRSPSAVGDVNGDGDLEVVLAGQGRIYIYDPGVPGYASEYLVSGGAFDGLSMADIDGDGAAEIGAYQDYGSEPRIHLFDGSLVPLPGWPYIELQNSPPFHREHTQFFDIDGDGDLEFAFGTGLTATMGMRMNVVDLPNPSGNPLRVDWSGTDGNPRGTAYYHEGEEIRHYVRGDANASGTVEFADVIASLQYLFGDGDAGCLRALDLDGDGQVELNDPIRLITILFTEAEEDIPYPYPNCGRAMDDPSQAPCEQPLPVAQCP